MMSELAELMDIFRPETRMLFFHFFFVEFAYLFFAKGLSFVLDKPLPWEAVTMVNLRDETQAAYGGNFMAATLSSHMKSFRYQAKVIIFPVLITFYDIFNTRPRSSLNKFFYQIRNKFSWLVYNYLIG